MVDYREVGSRRGNQILKAVDLFFNVALSVFLGFGALHHRAGESARLPFLCVPLPVLGNGCAVFPRASQS